MTSKLEKYRFGYKSEHDTVKLVQYRILDYHPAAVLQFFIWFKEKQTVDCHYEDTLVTMKYERY